MDDHAAEDVTVWHVYLVRCADGSLYTGIATDVERRLGEHVEGRGAKYLRGRSPLRLAAQRAVGERGYALQVERRIKRLGKGEKEALVARRELFDELIAAVASRR